MQPRQRSLYATVSAAVFMAAIRAIAATPAEPIECTVSLPARERPIAPAIYGMASAPMNVLTNACVPLNRWGGNTACRYNWQLGNAWNTGNDWFFENVSIERNAWQGFLWRAQQSGGQALITLPLIGYVAKDTQSHAFSVRKYGAQQKTDSFRPDAGNGRKPDGTPVTGNDRYDTSIVADPAFAAAWLTQMQKEFPALFTGKRLLVALGNEPMLWNVTHRDVHPNPVSYDEYLERFTAMAEAVRKVAPGVLITGPELWGWPAYFQSARDRESKDTPDRRQHGNEDFLPWFLRQMRAYETRTGVRLLDIVTVHFYPQADGVHSDAIDPKTSALRTETTRSLHDPTYRDPSWINERVELIPRLKRWVAQCYPGLRIGITEYNWGAEQDISGALALADILGIFGREGIDLACYWTYPPPGSYAANAYALYRNADGHGAAFGNRSLDVTISAPPARRDAVSLYAARDEAQQTLTLMAINKSALPAPLRITLKGIAAGAGTGYTVCAQTEGIAPLTPAPEAQEGTVRLELAPRSINHLRFVQRP